MKKILTFLFCFSIFSLFACFDSDPGSYTGQNTSTLTGENGSQTVIGSYYPRRSVIFNPWGSLGFEIDVYISTGFPFTLNFAFSGFLTDDGTQDVSGITRMMLWYWDKDAGWTCLHDIRNPKYEVISTGGKLKALFGRHTIKTAMGYQKDDVIPVVVYFSSEKYENWNLEIFLENRRKLLAPALANAGVIGIHVQDNIIPY